MLILYPTVYGKSVPCVAYADDIILYSYQMDWLENLLEQVVEFCNFTGLQLAPHKCVISANEEGWDELENRLNDIQNLPHFTICSRA